MYPSWETAFWVHPRVISQKGDYFTDLSPNYLIYSLYSVTAEDEGNYHCVVSPPGKYAERAEGKVSMPIRLEVIQTSEYSACSYTLQKICLVGY